MFTDTVNEFFVNRKGGGGATVRNIIIIVICFLVSVCLLIVGLLSMSILPIIILLIAGLGFLCYKLVRGKDVEFEYSFLTGDFSVAQIINKEKRKPYFSLDVKNVEQIGVYDPKTLSCESGSTLVDVSSGKREGNASLFLKVSSTNITETGKVKLGKGFVYIIVNNDERVRKAVKPYIRASVYREGMKNAE